MTQVTFYTNVSDRLAWVHRLVQKALNQRHHVAIFSDPEAAQSLSDGLWTYDPIAFLPNVLETHPDAPQSPVVIHWTQNKVLHDDILINLQATQLTVFGRFRHLIEVIGLEEEEKQQGRKRFAFYRDRGYTIKHVDMLDKSI